jgi:hypothetical protein
MLNLRALLHEKYADAEKDDSSRQRRLTAAIEVAGRERRFRTCGQLRRMNEVLAHGESSKPRSIARGSL